ncbi:MAG: chemotaxis response regulator CheY [Deltaproteobacteria bacterium]|nr:chemotaxis response regulator CheY [Deltaproteobacteria bacterium]
MKILVVDDFSTMRKIVKGILKKLDFTNIEEADDGAAALQKLNADKFDLIVSDWNMPNMSGLELLKAIRSSQELKEIPFLMVTAEAKKDNIIEAVKAGASNYIVKPFTEEVIQKKLEEMFKS